MLVDQVAIHRHPCPPALLLLLPTAQPDVGVVLCVVVCVVCGGCVVCCVHVSETH